MSADPRRRPLRVGVDMGGTKTEAVAVDDAGRVVARAIVSTQRGDAGVVATLTGVLDVLGADTARSAASIGVGIPGQIESGVVRHAVNLGVSGLDLGEALEAATGVPARVENDVKAAALGALALRGSRPGSKPLGADDGFAYLNLGTGVAVGIVVGGRLWRGAGGVAGEVGHMSVDPSGPECVCGQRGCIEAYAGGDAIARRWGRSGDLPVRDVFDASDAGDREAAELRAGLSRGVAGAVRMLVLTAGVSEIVVGGGLSALGDRLLADVSRELGRVSAESPFLRSLRLGERIELLPEGSPAAALGASLLWPSPAGESVPV